MSANHRDRLFALIVQWDELRDRGEPVSPEELCPDDPVLQNALRERIAQQLKIEQFIATPPAVVDSIRAVSPVAGTNQERDGTDATGPERIGRSRIEQLLGSGGFGRVYLAYDDELRRHVAIKIPHSRLLRNADYVETYRREARSVARLDHPHVVPVYDVGSSAEYPCFIVSKYIAGTSLYARMNESRLSFDEAGTLIATVAEALHYTHARGVVHRDIKPVNILLSASGEPFVVDFGLALNERDAVDGPRFAGTPAYMSPEQARGEAHRVDGRSDIFSLGVVLYELLTRQKPLTGKSDSELLLKIIEVDPQPPRQIDETIPPELERICLKAISKRASDRYQTAHDFARELRSFLDERWTVGAQEPHGGDPLESGRTSNGGRDQRIKIVPKGLRSYDAHDADFFLELIPGSRDRDGLPESLRFWKNRIEDQDDLFFVGVIFGPSGCGKSSFMKAGVIPRLSNRIIVVPLECGLDETETRLLHRLRKKCPGLPDDLNLVQTVARLRTGKDFAVGKKVLIVLDQFEQWLYANKENRSGELIQALRQCDGSHVQAITLVRDDFWLTASRFMKELEIRPVEGQNSMLIDLFSPEHARKVLEAFGQAYGRIPESARQTKEHKEFLDQSINDLATEGRIVPVRLSLFAEMMKDRPWRVATLKAMGGIHGVGVTFLEETFFGPTAPREYRHHQQAITKVLQLFLSESGALIRGHRCSLDQMREAAGYAGRPDDFEQIVLILDRELRLMTPTDSEETDDRDRAGAGQSDLQYFQLTHDYLVPSLHDWLNRKRKETRQGRAEILLQQWSSIWNSKPEQRNLPGLLDWARIVSITNRPLWTAPQQKMMRAAWRYHALRGTVVGLILLIATTIGLTIRGQVIEHDERNDALGLVKAVINAEIDRVPEIIDSMSASRKWVDPPLREAFESSSPRSRQKLNAGLALLRTDANQIGYVYHRLLQAIPEEVSVICGELRQYRSQLRPQLWEVALSTKPSQSAERLRAAAALALFDPDVEAWKTLAPVLAEQLVNENTFSSSVWNECFHPVKTQLLSPLADIYRDPRRSETERTMATNFLAEYAADQPEVLADLLMSADEKQFAAIFPKFLQQVDRATPHLERVVQQSMLETSDDQKESLAKRQANAAVALFRINRSALIWPLLKHSADPRARSYLIHRFVPLGADHQQLITRLEIETDITIRRALYLSLGNFDEQTLSAETRQKVVSQLRDIYKTDADPGLHAVSQWLLRKWNDEPWLKQTMDEWYLDQAQRESRFEEMTNSLTGSQTTKSSRWFVNSLGQTMILIPGPTEFMMGSDEVDSSHIPKERRHTRRIGRTFALATTPVTVEQYHQFDSEYGQGLAAEWFRAPDLPVIGLSWFLGAIYCNWLNEREGIPADQACFSIKGRVLRLKKNYLSLTGYRFPTEAEMEYATRAGSTTARYYGETEELLPHYAWFQLNSQEKFWPVGTRKPNDFGFFDTHGNVFTWCQESFQLYPDGDIVEDTSDVRAPDNNTPRSTRGGSFVDRPSYLRSAFRNADLPVTRNHMTGFRLARTINPSSSTTPPTDGHAKEEE